MKSTKISLMKTPIKNPPKPTKKKEVKHVVAKKKSNVDWESIEGEYKSGSLSIAEIARRNHITHQAVCKKAKTRGWSRDLTEEVRKRINQKLVADAVATRNGKATDEEIVDAAAGRGAEIIKLHRKDIQNLRRLEETLIDELQNNPTKLYLAQYQGQIIEKTVGLSASERSMAANNLANVQHKRISLERQAYNLNDTGEQEGVLILKPANISKPQESGIGEEG